MALVLLPYAAAAQQTPDAFVLDLRMRIHVRARQSIAPAAGDTTLPLERRTEWCGRLMLRRLHAPGVAYAGRLVFDTITVVVQGAIDRTAAAHLHAASRASFLVRFSLDSARIDSLGTPVGTEASYRQLLKDALPLLAHPVDLAARTARTERIAQIDGLYDVTWLPAEAPGGAHTVQRARVPTASLVVDSLVANIHHITARTGDPWPLTARMHRIHHQRIDGRTLAVVDRTLDAQRRTPVRDEPGAALPAGTLMWEPILTMLDEGERTRRVNRTTLGDDTWESLREVLGDAVRDDDLRATTTGKLRALMTLHPASIDSVVVHACAPGTSEAQRILLFNAVAETETDRADAALCTLFERLFGSGSSDEDLLVAVALRSRVPACMPPVLVAMHAQHADAWRRHHLALLASALLGRVRGRDTARTDALLDTLLSRPAPATARARYIGKAARCRDVARLRVVLAQADRMVREDAYAALCLIRCDEADALMRTLRDTETDEELRRVLDDELARRGMLPRNGDPVE